MRIKYDKGITPERMAEHLVNYIRDNSIIIGSVNFYVQVLDENGKAINEEEEDYLVVSPGELAKKQYYADVAMIRRGRLKAVNE